MGARRDNRGRFTGGGGGAAGGGGDDHERQVRVIMGELQRVIERVTIKITLDCTANLIETTPVDTGWARANWIPGLNPPGTEPLGKPDAIGPASAAQAQGTAAVAAYTLQQGRIFISNNVPYILILNDGHSNQAPAGFIQRAIEKAVTRDIRGLGAF